MNRTWLKSFAGSLKSNASDARRVSEKLIVIESDDWGAIRTLSKEVLNSYVIVGFELQKSS